MGRTHSIGMDELKVITQKADQLLRRRNVVRSATILVLLLAGCRSTSVEAAREPGEKIGGLTKESPDIAYIVDRVGPKSDHVRVRCLCRGEADGDTEFGIVAENAGIADPERSFANFSGRNGADEAVVETIGGARWRLRHAPGATIEISYDVRSGTEAIGATGDSFYRPIVRERLVHLLGETTFVRPMGIDHARYVDVAMEWVNFGDDWKLVSPFSRADALRPRSLAEFLHAPFVAGKDLAVHERMIDGHVLAVAIEKAPWGFTEADFVDHAERIMAAERRFFDDRGEPYFLITLIPCGEDRPDSIILGGTGLTNSFALFVTPRETLTLDTATPLSIAGLLAHELFHHWNGHLIQPRQPERLGYWFSEGFTDYYARRIQLAAGFMNVRDYVNDLNASLRRLWMNPKSTAENAVIDAEFWTDRDAADLPYQRGNAVALMLDRKIRSQTNAERSLDDFMKEMVAEARSDRGTLEWTTADMIERIERWTTREFADHVRRIVEKGELPNFDAAPFSPFFIRLDEDVPRFDPGFDIEKSRESGEVVGVRAGSKAASAGLSNGQKLLDLRIEHGAVETPIKLRVRVSDDKERSIEYLPHGATMKVPQLKLRDPFVKSSEI